MTDVVVIGAGIAGLSTAYSLTKAGKEVLVLEASARAGGLIKTSQQDGFLLEWGPNSTLKQPEIDELIEEIGLSANLLEPSEAAKNRYLAPSRKYPSKLRATPKSPWQALSSPLLSTAGKLRVLAEPFVRADFGEDTDVNEFISKKFGTELAERVFAPLLNGIWAADITRLSARSALPKLWENSQGGGSLLISGLLKKKPKSETKRHSMFSFSSGMEVLPQRLSAVLGQEIIKLQHPCTSIEKETNSYCVHFIDSTNKTKGSIACKNVVLTTSAPAAAALLKGYLPDATNKELLDFPYAPMGILHLAYEKEAVEHPLDGFGFLCQPAEKQVLLGAIFNSSIFPNRAPEGYHLITCFLGGARKPELANAQEKEIQESAISELGTLIQASQKPEILQANYIKKAIPNYPLNHFRLQSQFHEFMKANPGFHVLGNWLEGIGIPDRVRAAQTASDRVS